MLAMVTDWDSWRDGEEAVNVDAIVAQMASQFGARAQGRREIRRRACQKSATPSPIDRALDDAVITNPDNFDPELIAKLDAVAGRSVWPDE